MHPSLPLHSRAGRLMLPVLAAAGIALGAQLSGAPDRGSATAGSPAAAAAEGVGSHASEPVMVAGRYRPRDRADRPHHRAQDRLTARRGPRALLLT